MNLLNDGCRLKLLRLLSVLVIFYFEIVDCSGKKKAAKSAKAPENSVSIRPSSVSQTNLKLSLDLTNLPGITDVTLKVFKSPLKVGEQSFKHLSLDFDGISSDGNFPCALFGNEMIYMPESWTAPLSRWNRANNLMNLEGKMKEVGVALQQELFDHANSLSWVSDAVSIGNYVLVVSTSFVHLFYLISRLKNTPKCPEEVSLKIRSIIKNHLEILSQFCSDIKANSGQYGISHLGLAQMETAVYLNNLVSLRSETDLSGISDEMFEIFIDFLFQAYGEVRCEEMTQTFVEKSKPDFWIPLPIDYLRNRMIYDNKEIMMNFISNWTVKVVGNGNFDPRHLVNLGLLLQQQFMPHQVLFSIMTLDSTSDQAIIHYHKLNGEMIKFLTLLASTPSLLTGDAESGHLIGDFSNPQVDFQRSSLSEAEKVSFIERFWKLFVNLDDFVNMNTLDYDNLCALINRLDKVFPGIYQNLWGLFGDFESERNGLKFESDLKLKIEAFKLFQSWPVKLHFARANFKIEKTLEDLRMSSDLLYSLVELYTEILQQGVDDLSETSNHPEEVAIKELLAFSVEFIDLFLKKYATKAVIDYWYSKYDFYPTGLFDAIGNLCVSDHIPRLNSNEVLIYENLTKLIDNNLNFARIFMMMQVSKTLKYRFPAFVAKTLTPKCLIASGEADRLNYELFQSYLQAAKLIEPVGSFSDVVFKSLSKKLTYEVISFESARNLFTELERSLEIGTIEFDMSLHGFTDFWDPSLIITVLKNKTENSQVIADTFKAYLRIIGLKQDITITSSLLKHSSCFMGFFRDIYAEIVPERSAIALSREFIDQIFLGPQSDENSLVPAALILFQTFNISLIKGGITDKIAKTIYEKLFEISRTFMDYSLHEFSEVICDFIYSFNCALLAIIRVPGFKVLDEAKAVIHFYDFYRRIEALVPEPLENLIDCLVTKPTTLVLLYGRMISNQEVLPVTAFDSAIMKGSSSIPTIQGKYIAMLGRDSSRYSQIYLRPFIEWIKNDQMSFDSVIKLLKLITPDVQFNKLLNFLPIITEVLKCPSYTEKQKLDALEIAFSPENDNFIRTLSNLRNTMPYDVFIKLCHVQETRAFVNFISKCNSEVWFDGLRLNLKRAANQTLLNPSSSSSNLSTKSEAFRSSLVELISTGTPFYEKRRAVVNEIDEFIARDCDILPILRDSGSNLDPFKSIHIYLNALLWEIVDSTGCFFKVIPKYESYLEMLRIHFIIFKDSPRRKVLLGWILESSRSPELRLSITKMIPSLITIDNFVLTFGAISRISRWHEREPFIDSENASTIQDFILTVLGKVFEVIKAVPVGSEAPVFDQMLSVFCEVLGNDSSSLLVERIHEQIMEEAVSLDFSGHSEIFKNSTKFMNYVKLSMDFCKRNHLWTTQLMILLRRNAGFYINNKIDWIIIWNGLSQALPFEFMNSPLKVYSALGSVKMEQWEPLLSFLPSANLPANVLVSVVYDIVSKTGFELENLNILRLIPDVVNFGDFASFEQVDCVLKCIAKTLKYLDIKEEAYKRENMASAINDEDEDSFEVLPVELSPEFLRKLLVLLDLDSRAGKPRSWSWSRIFNVLHGSDKTGEIECIFLEGLLETYPTLMENTLINESTVLKFLFKIGQIPNRTSYTRYDELIAKIVSFYDKFTFTESKEADFRHDELFRSFKTHVNTLRTTSLVTSERDFHRIMSVVEQFNAIASNILPKHRQDNFAQLIILHFFSLLELVNSNNYLNDAALKVFSNQMTEVMTAVIKNGNLVSFGITMRVKDIEAFVQVVTEHVDLHDECNEILDALMTFSPDDVADGFFEQISDKRIRKDVCFISESIISQYKSVMKNGFKYVIERDWPLLYLDGLIEGPEQCHIDPKHFDAITKLLLQFDDLYAMDFPVIFAKLSDLVIKRENVLEHVFKFIDNLLESEEFKDKFELTDLYDNFFVDYLVKKFLTTSQPVFLNYLKKLKKRGEDEFDYWLNTDLKPETKNRLIGILQTDAANNTMALHSSIAEFMISAVVAIEIKDAESQLESVLRRFKRLEIKSVFPELRLRLSETFISKLMEVHEMIPGSSKTLTEAVKFISSFQVGENENLSVLALKTFDEDIFMSFIGRAAGRDEFVAYLNLFSSKINVVILKKIKNQLLRYELWENIELFEDAANNSDVNQIIEFLKCTKFSLETKLRIFNNAGTTSFTSVLNYFKCLFGVPKPDYRVILKAILENQSLMSQFIHPNSGKNRQAILGLLKKFLPLKLIKELIESCENKTGRLVLKFHFRATSWTNSIIDDVFLETSELVGFFDSAVSDAFSNSSDSNTIKAISIVKAFKLAEEIERFTEATISHNTISQLTQGLSGILQHNQNSIPKPAVVYAVYKMMSRLGGSKKMERGLITRWLLFSGEIPHIKNFEAFLQAQLDSREIDWELHGKLVGKTFDFPEIQRMMNEFEANYRN